MPKQFALDVDLLIDPILRDSIDRLRLMSPELGGMAGYHLGFLNADFADLESTAISRGKRIRATLALLACSSISGSPEKARHLAAAIELLHAFTLVHDDIQDTSAFRRHRPTVWSLWGTGQGINVGDALFAESTRVLLESRTSGVGSSTVLDLAKAFQECSVTIVGGQVLDLGFELRDNVTVDDYRRMIEAKTGALLKFSLWAGARVAGASATVADQFGALGAAVGIAFQIRDDYLGIWGDSEHTGKSDSDDLRQRKRTYPIVLLHERLDSIDRATFNRKYFGDDLSREDVETVLDLLRSYEIRERTLEKIAASQNAVRSALETIDAPVPYAFELLQNVVEDLADRSR